MFVSIFLLLCNRLESKDNNDDKKNPHCENNNEYRIFFTGQNQYINEFEKHNHDDLLFI